MGLGESNLRITVAWRRWTGKNILCRITIQLRLRISLTDCASEKAKLLGMMGMDNVVMVLVIIGYVSLTLWYSREHTRNKRWTRRMSSMKSVDWLGSRSRGRKGSIARIVILAVLFTCIQFLFNLGSAYAVKNAPGYEHVNASLLALLFCTRPHLSWIVCILPTIPRTWIERSLTTQQLNLLSKGMMGFTRVGVSVAISEIMMQFLGSYYMGRTVHVGLEREFYKHNNLSPYWKGIQARNMYNGAMLWAIALPLILII